MVRWAVLLHGVTFGAPGLAGVIAMGLVFSPGVRGTKSPPLPVICFIGVICIVCTRLAFCGVLSGEFEIVALYGTASSARAWGGWYAVCPSDFAAVGGLKKGRVERTSTLLHGERALSRDRSG